MGLMIMTKARSSLHSLSDYLRTQAELSSNTKETGAVLKSEKAFTIMRHCAGAGCDFQWLARAMELRSTQLFYPGWQSNGVGLLAMMSMK